MAQWSKGTVSGRQGRTDPRGATRESGGRGWWRKRESRKTERKNDRVLQMKGPGDHVSVAKPHICYGKIWSTSSSLYSDLGLMPHVPRGIYWETLSPLQSARPRLFLAQRCNFFWCIALTISQTFYKPWQWTRDCAPVSNIAPVSNMLHFNLQICAVIRLKQGQTLSLFSDFSG